MMMRYASIGVVSLVALCGCYSHAYHERSPVAANNRIAIDEHSTLEYTQWSYFWGLLNEAPFSPEAGECDNRGAGKVVSSTPWFGVPVSLLSLGIASPATLTVYCSVDPGPPPVGP